jgi:hypothetical protein
VTLFCEVNAEDIFYTVKERTRPMYRVFYQNYLEPGEKVRPAFRYADIGNGSFTVGYYIEYPDMIGAIEADALYIKDSDNFDRSIIFTKKSDGTFESRQGWIPTFYLEAIEKNDPETILSYEPFIESVYSAWQDYNMFSPTIFYFHNIAFCIRSALIYGGPSAFFITSLTNRGNSIYQLETLPAIMSDKYIKDTRLEQFEDREKYILYIHHRKNRLRIYVEGEEFLHWELMKTEQQFNEKFEQFPNAGHWPGDKDYKSCLAPDIFEPWPVLPLTDLKNVIDKKPITTISHTLTSNLRLRTKPGTSAAVEDTLPEGSGVYVLQTGDSATIDGITAPWVYVAAQNVKQGWCFSGYLEEVREEPEPAAAAQDALPETQTDGEAENSGIPPAALIGGGIIVIAALFALIRRKKKA